MNHDRLAFITAYRALHGGDETEADRALRGVELAYAAQQNAELQEALDAADGEHLLQTEGYRERIAAMTRILEAFPVKHARFSIRQENGDLREADTCFDWCYACTLERLQSEASEWKSREDAARAACLRIAQIHGHFGSVLALLQAGEYDKAIAAVQTHEGRRHAQTGRTVVTVIAVEDNCGPLDCCDEETVHVWVDVLTWSGRRAYLTGASPFLDAAGPAVLENPTDLKDARFYATLPFEPPPATPELGEQLEWPDLELCPPIEEIKEQLGIPEH